MPRALTKRIGEIGQWARNRISLVRSRFARDVAVLVGANGIQLALNLVAGIMVARWLGARNYGVVGSVIAFPSLIFALCSARTADAMVRYMAEFEATGEQERLAGTCRLGYLVDSAATVVAFLAVLASAHWAETHIVRAPGTAGLVLIYGASYLPLALAGTSQAALSVQGKFPLLAWVDSGTTVVRVALLIALVWAGYGVAGAIWGNAVGNALRGLALGILGSQAVKSQWKLSWLGASFSSLRGRRREICSFLIYGNVNRLLGSLVKQLDIVLLGYVQGPLQVGYYRLAKSFASMVGYLVGPLQSVSYPELSKLAARGRTEGMRKRIKGLFCSIALPLAALVAAGALFAGRVVPLAVGDSYRPAVAVIQLMVLGASVWLLFFWLRPMYFALGKLKLWTTNTLLVNGCALVGFYFGVLLSGALGLAVVQFLRQIAQHGLGAVWLSRQTEWRA